METIKPSLPWADKSQLKMVDVGSKASTHRRAQAQGEIRMSQAAFLSVVDGNNPKGNVLAVAEVAGIMAAKKTAESIPLCHPLPLDQVRLRFHLNEKENSILVFCEVSTTAKTGVEMEALAGVNGALLSIYDLSKAVDPVLSLSNIRLNLKEGGKSGRWVHPDSAQDGVVFSENSVLQVVSQAANCDLSGVSAAILTISDRVSKGEAQDFSGPEIESFLVESGGSVCRKNCVPDDKGRIQAFVRKAIFEADARLVITTGGTGLSPRDVTPEALEEICDRIIPGVGECLRAEGAKKTSTAWLSRSLGGMIGNTLVIALPGSPKAVREGLEALKPFLHHALHVIRGGNHDSIR